MYTLIFMENGVMVAGLVWWQQFSCVCIDFFEKWCVGRRFGEVVAVFIGMNEF